MKWQITAMRGCEAKSEMGTMFWVGRENAVGEISGKKERAEGGGVGKKDRAQDLYRRFWGGGSRPGRGVVSVEEKEGGGARPV